ncbi:MAG TPA: TetR/AcrR family transcriptional regulator [Candidatus Baltobacteraceae bacterium]|nr:TetR/AcrR family transcriptional regulator [Candidatus Baltobacteraceae bacterium]
MLQRETTPARSSEETRNRIFAAARQLLAKKGRRGTTTREIAELAGVNEATLFRHFGSKDALIQACILHYCPAGDLKEFLPNLSGDIEKDLRAIAHFMTERMESLRDLILTTFVEEDQWSAAGDAAWRAPAMIKQVVTDYMASRVASGDLEGDPFLMARLFMGTIFAYVIGRKRMHYPEYSLDQIIEFNINVFLNGVRKKTK